ncbi:hypothetical protein ACN4EG_20385 [Alkalinema pantanalense CENA528]|uniref:hypothetical protein n=1 Tax=Alkalinema pantanalense TaxID=1620705 RepID=UPI003D6F51FE
MKQSRQWIRWSVVSICFALLIIRQVKPDFFNVLQTIKLDIFSVSLLVIVGFALIQPYLGSWLRYISLANKRWLLVIACLVLIVLRVIFPNAQADPNSIWLMGIAALIFILPDLKSVAPYIKKIKVGDTELELKESIGNLGKEVEKAQDAAALEQKATVSENVSFEIEKVLEESGKDPKAALLLLSAKIEQQLRNRLEEAGISTERVYSASRYVEMGVKADIFPQDFFPAFRDFWSVRNRVAHGAAFDVDDSYILSLVSLGTDLLKIASTTSKGGDQDDDNQIKSSM